jgi:hypothetical protein
VHAGKDCPLAGQVLRWLSDLACGGGAQFDLIQDNLKYFLEILQNQKSDLLEYAIVALIALEIIVSLWDMWTRHH